MFAKLLNVFMFVYILFSGVELRSNKNPCMMPSELYDPRSNVINISYPINVGPEFELPNEQQISYYEQLMMKSNETIILSNFLETQKTQVCPTTTIHKKPESIQGQVHCITPLPKSLPEYVPYYKICFKILKMNTKDVRWKLCLITEHSTELRFEIQQIYLHMWLYYTNYMKKVDLGVLDTCNRIVGFGHYVTETERFYLTIRDDYLMATQILILFKNILINQNASIIKDITNNLEVWKNLIQKMSTNPKMYEFSTSNTSLEINELLGVLIKSYFKTRHCLETCFDLLKEQENMIKEREFKDEMLCKYWYLMIGTNLEN